MEPGVPGLELKNVGRLTYNEDLTVLRLTELQPYIDVILEIDPTSLDNIAWRIPKPKIKVHTVPNQFKEIHVPVEVIGEVAGMVYLRSGNSQRGQGRIIINIFDESGNQAARVLSEGDGYFTYLGLSPGKYTAEIDASQLEKLGYRVSPAEIPFEIEVSEYGDIVDDLEFVLSPEESPSSE